MHKRIALRISVLCCAFLLTTAVMAAPRHQKADAGSAGSSVAKSQHSGSAFSLQRLLGERIRLTRDLLRTLRALEATEKPQPGLGTLGIVDGPDPFSLSGKEEDEPGEEPDERQERHQREADSVKSSTKPYQTLH